MPITVAVTGASGKMTQEVITAVSRDRDLRLIGAVSHSMAETHLSLAGGRQAPVVHDLETLLNTVTPDVLVDFTNAAWAMPALRTAIAAGVRPIIGTSGITDADVAELRNLCAQHHVGGVFAANFALGAVVGMHLAAIAARYFDAAEIIEMHHDQKADAPSGTAIATAQLMAKARGRPFDNPEVKKEVVGHPRAASLDGIVLHSMRLPGALAHQEVVFGALGQTLHIRHNALSRECYMPGVLIAIKEVMRRDELVVGLESVLGLA